MSDYQGRYEKANANRVAGAFATVAVFALAAGAITGWALAGVTRAAPVAEPPRVEYVTETATETVTEHHTEVATEVVTETETATPKPQAAAPKAEPEPEGDKGLGGEPVTVPRDADRNQGVVVDPDDPRARSVWFRLADCESGEWVNSGESFIENSADWYVNGQFDGGLQFHPNTWNWLKPDGYPAYAYQATIEQQINVAERVLEKQGWKAWPTCSRLLGLR